MAAVQRAGKALEEQFAAINNLPSLLFRPAFSGKIWSEVLYG